MTDLVDKYLLVWKAIEAARGPSRMARIWRMSIRLAIAYHTGERKLPAARCRTLAATLRSDAARALRLADRLDPP